MKKSSLSEDMYAHIPHMIIAFHGCDKKAYKKVICEGDKLFPSTNDYDWLGNGIYFWEQNLERAWQWAEDKAKRAKDENYEPAVVGAIIELGHCLNLVDSDKIQILKNHYSVFELQTEILGKSMPKNENVKNNTDLLIRKLDCAVIESLHTFREENDLTPYDSVRGVFFEGKEIYPTSGFYEKSHIQICIRNPNCIKGYFSPRDIDENWNIP